MDIIIVYASRLLGFSWLLPNTDINIGWRSWVLRCLFCCCCCWKFFFVAYRKRRRMRCRIECVRDIFAWSFFFSIQFYLFRWVWLSLSDIHLMQWIDKFCRLYLDPWYSLCSSIHRYEIEIEGTQMQNEIVQFIFDTFFFIQQYNSNTIFSQVNDAKIKKLFESETVQSSSWDWMVFCCFYDSIHTHSHS